MGKQLGPDASQEETLALVKFRMLSPRSTA